MPSPTPSLTDPPVPSPIAEGMMWVQGIALGSTATAIAVIAIAAIGLLMLSGRLELRRGITVVIGCFILFGAPGIAVALVGFGGSDENSLPVVAVAVDITPPLRADSPPSSAYDPYAGASVPGSR